MLKEIVRNEMVKAMKNKDAIRKLELSTLLSALTMKEKEKQGNLRVIAEKEGRTISEEEVEKQGTLTETEETEVVAKELKTIKETLSFATPDRTDIISECNAKISVLNEFMPQQMTAEDIKAVINKILADLNISVPQAKDKGAIMKVLMPLVKGKADGKEVNNILSTYF